jgi:CRP-like cAMP-binding protein
MQESFYETLLQLPLFQGLGYHDLTNIVSKVKMDFRKYEPGKTIVEEGEACKDVIFLLNGTLTAKRASANKRIIFSERINSPDVIGVNSLFGLSQHHERTYIAESNTQLLVINKQFIIHNMLVYEVCQFNFLNTLSTVIHRSNKMLWEIPSDNITKRFIQILKRNYLKPSGEKRLNGKMVDIAKYLGTTRLNVSRMLNHLQEKGLIELGRKHIVIPAFQDLVHYGEDLNE